MHIFDSPFWQSVAGSLLANAIFALLLSTAMISFVRHLAKQAWLERQTIRLWLTVPLFLYVGLLAIRFNTVSAKESTIASLRQSVDRLNEQLAPRHLTAQQKACLKEKLSKGSPGEVHFAWAGANAEAFQYAVEVDDVVEAGHWKVDDDQNMFYPFGGLLIIVGKTQIPAAATVLRDAFSTCRVSATWHVASDAPPQGFRLYVGPKE